MTELDVLCQAAMSISHGSGRHRIELLIGDHVLPYSMTVYEAVKQFSRSSHDHEGGTDTDTDSEMLFGNASIWINTHTIWSLCIHSCSLSNVLTGLFIY